MCSLFFGVERMFLIHISVIYGGGENAEFIQVHVCWRIIEVPFFWRMDLFIILLVLLVRFCASVLVEQMRNDLLI